MRDGDDSAFSTWGPVGGVALFGVALVVGATVFVALCAHVSIPLMPLTPVPLTAQNLAVLLVGLLLQVALSAEVK